ncbi:MAG: hypothetical protein IPK66_04370 [Rhodospirillales bacterium]|nr:hypothetical protein [Rhodospirillales bacterium]
MMLRHRSSAALVLLLAVAAGMLSAGSARAAAFELAAVIELLKREIAAAQAAGDANSTGMRIDEAQLDLDLVEVPAKAGGRLLVPANDFAAEKSEALRPALKRRIVIELVLPKPSIAVGGAAGGLPTAPLTPPSGLQPQPGALSRAVADIETAVRAGADAAPAAEPKRVTLDLDFALDRDSKGAPQIVVFAGERRIEPKTVQKLRLRISDREK